MRAHCHCHRRGFAAGLAASAVTSWAGARPAQAQTSKAGLIAAAFRLRDQAVGAGDQPYGAVVVRDGIIIGEGASRVIAEHNGDAHAERVALRAAITRIGTHRLPPDTVIYSSSVPCAVCQRALAAAGVSRMYWGIDGADGGPPRS
ncbi:MAG: deaminase [Beijerinckiaceae bacterium]